MIKLKKVKNFQGELKPYSQMVIYMKETSEKEDVMEKESTSMQLMGISMKAIGRKV